MASRRHLARNLLTAILVLGQGLVPFQQSFAASDSDGDDPPIQNAASVSSEPTDPSAAKDKELKRLQSILITLNQELEATYHQFQMIQEARRGIVQSMFDPHPGLDPRSYDEMVRDREQAVEQEKQLSNQMNKLLDKAQAIETKMNPLLERVYQLIPEAGSYQPKEEESPPPKQRKKETGDIKIKPIPY